MCRRPLNLGNVYLIIVQTILGGLIAHDNYIDIASEEWCTIINSVQRQRQWGQRGWGGLI